MDKAAKETKDKDEEKPEGEGAEGGEEGLNPPKKKLSLQLIIIIVMGLIILLGGGAAGLYFAGVIGGGGAAHEAGVEKAGAGGEHGVKDAATEGHGGGEEAAADNEGTAPKYYSLGDILVNLSGDGKRPNFLKIKVSLELADEKNIPALDTLKPRIIDHFQVYLRELRIEDLRGSAGLYRLREELLLRVTEVVQPIRVRDVLFQEMLVQ